MPRLSVEAIPGMRPLHIEELLWKPREDDKKTPSWEGHPNFWIATDGPDGTHLRQTAGINPVAMPRGRKRRPAVAIFVTPPGQGHRLPWLDEVDLDTGFVRYFGDNKPDLRVQAEAAPGNKVLLDEMNRCAASDREARSLAAPLIFFMNLGNAGGGVLTQFLGYGLVRTAHRVTQLHKGRSFTNYAFDCVLLRGEEDEEGREMLNFAWIDIRRDPKRTDAETTAAAPRSWRQWVEKGTTSLDHADVRRVVLRGDVQTYDEQVPAKESTLGRVLESVYRRYDGNYKHGFQALAALATELVIAGPGLNYHEGWVTPVGLDGGVDFVQRLDLGRGFSSTKLVVLGQAKCRKPWPRANNGVSAEELARVVARLRRGWIGAYVTTSFFTEVAQREMVADEYPIVLIPGRRVAQAAEELRDTLGIGTVQDFLNWVDGAYQRMLAASRSRPSDIVRETPEAMASPREPDIVRDDSVLS
jgi:Restriction endonuclease AspBHI N-terminal/Restriction endonuclease